uniref:Lipocalin domain-containing protein n=1 Tax=Meloidogyne javanica TaxID=6303 RepID=A0A915LKL8_MELJA
MNIFIKQIRAQHELFNSQNFAPKPTIAPDLAKYFELDGHARELVDTLIAPRPGGYFPEKTYEHVDDHPRQSPQKSSDDDQLQSTKHSIDSDSSSLPLPQTSPSSIAGIPNDFPKLPKFPMSALPAEIRRQQPQTLRQPLNDLPRFASKPEIPDGGLGLAASLDPIRPNSVSASEPRSSFLTSSASGDSYGDSSADSIDEPAPGGLIGTIMDLFGLNKDGRPQTDASGIGRAVGSLLGGSNSPLPGKQVISNVLYKALTSGSVQSPTSNDSTPANASAALSSLSSMLPANSPLAAAAAALFSSPELNTSTPLTLTQAQQEAIGENLEMIQNLIVQPSSPLCSPKPVVVQDFLLDALMGQWYQVVYSPLVAQSGCSVVSYRKISDVNGGGIGSIFEVFEYSTDGTPYSKPKINSGYGILKQQGELIFRTTAHQEDVDIHVIFVGPLNAKGQYEFVVLSSNCNYPLYRYETAVMQMLEQKGVINGFSKLLNTVTPVDASTCMFPPNLFAHAGSGFGLTN